MRLLPMLAAAMLVVAPATAALAPGAKALPFTAQGAVAGKPYQFDLKTALKQGPVVLYFFPAAFTAGCNAEAHAFAQALPRFKAAGAIVVGITAGNVDQLAKFSREMCAGKFPVVAASADVVADYGVVLPAPGGRPSGYTTRTSFVIAPDGSIFYVFNDMNPAGHVENTLEAVRRLTAHRG